MCRKWMKSRLVMLNSPERKFFLSPKDRSTVSLACLKDSSQTKSLPLRSVICRSSSIIKLSSCHSSFVLISNELDKPSLDFLHGTFSFRAWSPCSHSVTCCILAPVFLSLCFWNNIYRGVCNVFVAVYVHWLLHRSSFPHICLWGRGLHGVPQPRTDTEMSCILTAATETSKCFFHVLFVLWWEKSCASSASASLVRFVRVWQYEVKYTRCDFKASSCSSAQNITWRSAVWQIGAAVQQGAGATFPSVMSNKQLLTRASGLTQRVF